MKITTTHEWIDGDKIPAEGGVILVQNHITQIDPVTSAHITLNYGRASRYLAKASLFKNRLLGGFMRAAGQIPVERDSPGGKGAFDAAVEAVNAGELVVVYPEGSVTKDPDGWPMVGKTGAARIALATGAPVIPVGQWGAQELMPAYGKPQLRGGRKHIRMKVGDPVPLEDLRAKQPTREVVAEATDRIMKAILALVADVRGEEPPPELFDPRKAGVSATGNPNKKPKK
ncbi:lysophospholipid acyltransferase family protein [Nocardioides sp.]|uniref:lysophospholipid acyltransferase family protein n=1 Tax=Nocardioides sp. TaxID=35761 RepID=UPI0039E3343C